VQHRCPDGWEYAHHPKRKKLAQRVAGVLARLRSRRLDGVKAACDTRPVHGELFADLTPPHFTYFAGHYRGEPFRCLDDYRVEVRKLDADGRPIVDRSVGAEPQHVSDKMFVLAQLIQKALAAADESQGGLSDEDHLLHVIGMACHAFDLFLQVHPFANGNGHAARFIMWAILGRYGYWPVRLWTVEPRPPEPPYTQLLLQHRAGDRKPLIQYVLTCIR
jgi:fido (protein-threonine AMPylation protein)